MDINFHYICATVLHIDRKLFIIIACISKSWATLLPVHAGSCCLCSEVCCCLLCRCLSRLVWSVSSRCSLLSWCSLSHLVWSLSSRCSLLSWCTLSRLVWSLSSRCSLLSRSLAWSLLDRLNWSLFSRCSWFSCCLLARSLSFLIHSSSITTVHVYGYATIVNTSHVPVLMNTISPEFNM